jgi:hypothetical protein
LEAEGLIRIEPRKGAYLRRLSMVEIRELYDTREALEAHVVRTTAVTAALLADLRQSLKRQRALLKANDKPHSYRGGRGVPRPAGTGHRQRVSMLAAGQYSEPDLAVAPQNLRPSEHHRA